MPFYIDNSTLSALYSCTSKAWIRYGQHLTTSDERAELLSGQAGHAALAAYHMGGSIDEALNTFDVIYRLWASSNVDPNDRLAFHNTRSILKRFLEEHPYFTAVSGQRKPSAKWPYVPLEGMIEVPFEVPLDDHGDYIFMGRIDLIEMRERPAKILDRVLAVDQLDLIEKCADRRRQVGVDVQREARLRNLVGDAAPLGELRGLRIGSAHEHRIMQRAVHGLAVGHLVDERVALQHLHRANLRQDVGDRLR